MSKLNELHQVIVKSLTHKSVQETFDFFSNPKNMELGEQFTPCKRILMVGIPLIISLLENPSTMQGNVPTILL